jgi:hypothetical protein
MNTYLAEVTDLFCGEMNYSYLNKHEIEANSLLGAIQKLSRMYGLNFRKQYGTDWEGLYHSTSKLTGLYIEEIEE